MKNFKCQFEIQSDFRYLPFLTRIFKALKIKKANALTQILVDATHNAVIHGHKRKKEKWVGIAIDVREKKVKIQVRDQGKGARKKNDGLWTMDYGLWGTTGRGLQIINALADRVISKRKNGFHIFEAVIVHSPPL